MSFVCFANLLVQLGNSKMAKTYNNFRNGFVKKKKSKIIVNVIEDPLCDKALKKFSKLHLYHLLPSCLDAGITSK